ncbi:AcrR family transcriptional regulator [Kitasatospora sp. MAA4]|uniref:TetR/AcrR family transcriptional regulator n=1 Tax=Kitasatospora sp. MAA4 TaxID=3035093 RepID=UPI002475E6BC|nr:TetR/AcrR family transcriptional regulator [Kitasatospora sp. MAA4]MDH6136807.1 AcrR family transcriptional regulator [Kitasatospora sp. MAA4]
MSPEIPEEGTKHAKRSYHHGSLHPALIDAGLALARTGGPSAVVLRAVSREAGVSHNAAYRHFANHEDLLAAVGERAMAELGRLMLHRMAGITAPDEARLAQARLAAIGRAYVDFALAEPGWFRTAFSGATAHPHPPAAGAHPPLPEPPPDPLPEPPPDPGTDPFLILGAALDHLVTAGTLPATRRPGAEYAAWSAVHGLSALLVDGPLRTLPEAEARRAVESVLAVVARGL